MKIPFNTPYLSGNELRYIEEVVKSGRISGNGVFTQKCHEFFQDRYGFRKVLLTTSCTDALEMAAILCNIQPGDEVIAPSYAFVSTVNPFVLRGAHIVFADSPPDHPNLDVTRLEALITPKTKAIALVHYAGMACDMDPLMALAEKYDLLVVEDAAHAIDAYYRGRPLGSIGHLGSFSFHATKNITCGEGGLLVINDPQFEAQADIIREKGTNWSAFNRGEVTKYEWVDLGSSFLPTDMVAAFLYAQLEHLDTIQHKRRLLWDRYYAGLRPLERQGTVRLPIIPPYATHNAHIFYLVCNSNEERTRLIATLQSEEISAVFHYLALHNSPYYQNQHDGRVLPNSTRYTECLLRLPLFYALQESEIEHMIKVITAFYS